MTQAQRDDLWRALEQDEILMEQELEDRLQFPDPPYDENQESI